MSAAPEHHDNDFAGSDGYTGTYSQTLAGTGGTTPYAWSVTTGILPSGLTLNSSGVISGTVGASAVSETFTVKLTDANGVTATKSLTITVNAAPSITTTTLATATQTETGYAQTGVWYLMAPRLQLERDLPGAPPTGLTLNPASGVISGTVGASAVSASFTITLTDADGVTASKSLTITVNVKPSVTTTTLAAATQNQTGYTQTLAGTGGTLPYTWSVTSGILPSGLTLSSSGVISGTVGASAVSETFTVQLFDANAVIATKSLTITVNGAPNITTTTLPGATRTYSELAVASGTTPYAWSITTGILPSGLTLNAATGVISGRAR